MLQRIKQQGLDIVPRILIVSPVACLEICLQLILKPKFNSEEKLALSIMYVYFSNWCLWMLLNAEHCHILRVPLRNEKGTIRKWISRFEVWPYLETYTEDAAHELAKELQGKPDLIVGIM
ncbi:sucrose synthase-like [Lotus japonicus]|uniref:sucrose synthase-like n=1 Tax=Lotus japonicus TaxID=34305 RepID=UPI002588CE7A|nr:sucrose synthase-like [Lotus japonicus]